MESIIWGCPRPLPSSALAASWQKGLEVKDGLQAVQFNLGAEVSQGRELQGREGWQESSPNKSKSFVRWQPWLHVSRELGPGPGNACLLYLKKEKRGFPCVSPLGRLPTRRNGGWLGEMERQSLPPVRSVLPVRQALGCQSGQIKPDTRPMMGLTGHRG